ncbi:hypothetical protein Tco_1111373 [Tanacetum coccineum]|uniref:Uncharacterized protein n=1 Tax=Tanacetum coccineum TaxID=301880 RepID=A0ABQ5ILF3_9ASTR
MKSRGSAPQDCFVKLPAQQHESQDKDGCKLKLEEEESAEQEKEKKMQTLLNLEHRRAKITEETNDSFVPMDSEVVKGSKDRVEGSETRSEGSSKRSEMAYDLLKLVKKQLKEAIVPGMECFTEASYLGGVMKEEREMELDPTRVGKNYPSSWAWTSSRVELANARSLPCSPIDSQMNLPNLVKGQKWREVAVSNYEDLRAKFPVTRFFRHEDMLRRYHLAVHKTSSRKEWGVVQELLLLGLTMHSSVKGNKKGKRRNEQVSDSQLGVVGSGQDLYKPRVSSKRYIKDPVECMQDHDKFGIPQIIISYNVRDASFNEWNIPSLCQDLVILLMFTSFYHPQEIGQSRSALTVILSKGVEIKEFEVRQNEKRRREDLDILEERREIASIRKVRKKSRALWKIEAKHGMGLRIRYGGIWLLPEATPLGRHYGISPGVASGMNGSVLLRDPFSSLQEQSAYTHREAGQLAPYYVSYLERFIGHYDVTEVQTSIITGTFVALGALGHLLNLLSSVLSQKIRADCISLPESAFKRRYSSNLSFYSTVAY